MAHIDLHISVCTLNLHLYVFIYIRIETDPSERSISISPGPPAGPLHDPGTMCQCRPGSGGKCRGRRVPKQKVNSASAGPSLNIMFNRCWLYLSRITRDILLLGLHEQPRVQEGRLLGMFKDCPRRCLVK